MTQSETCGVIFQKYGVICWMDKECVQEAFSARVIT